SGLHTNGYSLARRVLFGECGMQPDDVLSEVGVSVADALLAEHRSYLKAVVPLLDQDLIKGMAHITGGGITENLPRTLPDDCDAVVSTQAWHVPALFRVLQERGTISREEMFRAFNMGVGLILVCAKDHESKALDLLRTQGESPIALGRISRGERRVV